ncbi:NAD(P)/FAD-dependent oxidoreductase [Actinophytocola gossypii]|uniref:NAD(P)/FAD-dependent oxidoreductase n=1 Tax=Actinophytocola gossypii TaxID=2812003 RepID=A0ABT2J701_9PSEU|nr:NAD(P)/FAD-dependent oxidoreductase [Actinophytocola gossypii]MCT2583384.1 NAD(P)/FAD-dependent oxidoreductase [Actinophytocola gossypii]
MSDNGQRRPRVVVVGAGFAGYHCLRTLERRLPPDAADLCVVNPTDYMLYVPLLPEVAGGSLDPRRVAVPLRTKLKRTQAVLGDVTGIDLDRQTATVTNVEGTDTNLHWDRLVIASGSVTRLLSIPGVAEYAKGFKSVAESIYLRDHILRQLELAEQTDDPAERRERTTFVVVGAGYTGTELVAQGAELTRQALRRYRGLREEDVRWVLIDMADRILPNLSERLSGPAQSVLERRGVDVRLKTSVSEVTQHCARLTDDTEIPTRTVVWCVGVRPDPLVEPLNLPTTKGRLNTDAYLQVPGQPKVFAAGDVAAVPDLTRPGEITPMTAQHAQRQGRVAGINVAASLGVGEAREYKHRDLGFVVDLAGSQAVADPLHVPLRGFPAKVVTRGYHLMAMPSNRLRVAFDWAADLLTRRQVVHFGLVPEEGISLAEADGQRTGGFAGSKAG